MATKEGLTSPGPVVLDEVTAHSEYVAPFLRLILNWWEPCECAARGCVLRISGGRGLQKLVLISTAVLDNIILRGIV